MSELMNVPGYDKLAAVLVRAYQQAAAGKGKERHASEGVPFEEQPISAINRVLGSVDGMLYQAAKKAQEARRLPAGRAQAELLGAINYLAAAVIAMDTWAADTLPSAGPATLPPAAPGSEWKSHDGSPRPVPINALVAVLTREPVAATADVRRGDGWRWDHRGHRGDIMFYKVIGFDGRAPDGA